MFIKIRASQKNVHLKQQFIKKRASQGFLDPIQKRALSRSVQLEAVYLEALLYGVKNIKTGDLNGMLTIAKGSLDT